MGLRSVLQRGLGLERVKGRLRKGERERVRERERERESRKNKFNG